MAVALSIFIQDTLGIQRLSMFYFSAVLICSAWLGVPYGLLAAVAATAAFSYVLGDQPNRFTLGTRQDLINLAVFSAGAWAIGVYSDEIRRRSQALMRLSRLDGEIAAERRRPPPPGRSPAIQLVGEEARRVLTAASLVALAAMLAPGAEAAFGVASVSALYLAGVVVASVALGTRAGLLAAALAVILYDFMVVEPRGSLSLDTVQAGANLVLFVGMGWWVGSLAENAHYERSAIRSLFEAGRTLSATADEAELRKILCDSISVATGGGYVALVAPDGEVLCERGDRTQPPPQLAPDAIVAGRTVVSGRWRLRALGGDGRSLGVVVWRTALRTGQSGRSIDGAVNLVADLGGAAIARAQLSAANARMEAAVHAQELLRALLASVSHDLRTPLAGILGAADTLMDYWDRYDATVRLDLLSNIKEQGHRLHRYIENIMGMTRLDAGTLRPQMSMLLLEPLVFDAREAVVEQSRSGAVRIDVDPQTSVKVDPMLLQQVLINVLENALKLSPAGAQVHVADRRAGAEVELVVRDFGPGVPPEALDKLFEPFFQGDRKTGGVGLGLFIARSFMVAMRGSIGARPPEDGRPGLEIVLTMQGPEASHG